MQTARLTQANRDLRSEGGITLVELLVSMVMLIVLSAAAMTLLMIVVRSQPRISDRDYAIQQGRVLQESLARELRQSYGVNSAGTTQIVFYTYLRHTSCGSTTQSSASTPAIPCRVTYSCTSGTCQRTETGLTGGNTSTRTLVTGLASSSLFGYSPSTTNPSYVSTTLVFPADGGDDAVTLQDGVELRNHS